MTFTYTPVPTSKEQRKKGGRKNLGTTFKNQGQCLKFVDAEKHAVVLRQRTTTRSQLGGSALALGPPRYTCRYARDEQHSGETAGA